ncbi:MAG: hypothetical protein CM15mP29_0480 [Alphaproteobacteria bacterium]|nr:MAG: hypothetical protein CM15mP29_0480 [Alphaproteobacteria bacterium]
MLDQLVNLATIAFVGNIPGETQTLPLPFWVLIETSITIKNYELGIISISLALSALLMPHQLKNFLKRLRNNN